MITIEFNAAPVFARLNQAAQLLEDLTPIHEDIGDYMTRSTKARFQTGEAPDGTRWAAKKPATIARYIANGDGARPDPLIGPSRRLSNEIAALATSQSVEIGSSLEYSGVMQRGAPKGAFGKSAQGRPLPWGDIPARVWLGISDTDERNILDIVDEHLEAAIGR
jgi:phage virion morphogenesis protein